MEQLARAMVSLTMSDGTATTTTMDVINQRKHMRERTPTVPQVILQPHKEGYDIEDYIQAFEKVMHTS